VALPVKELAALGRLEITGKAVNPPPLDPVPEPPRPLIATLPPVKGFIKPLVIGSADKVCEAMPVAFAAPVAMAPADVLWARIGWKVTPVKEFGSADVVAEGIAVVSNPAVVSDAACPEGMKGVRV
jgi:hypothetical protein